MTPRVLCGHMHRARLTPLFGPPTRARRRTTPRARLSFCPCDIQRSPKMASFMDRAVSIIWDTPSQTWVRPAGTFVVYVGASIKDIRPSGSF
ncbi:hypothetical protein B0H10DRAFT_473846 [Mycena sp. CBHHK59/15]|nr:hypothetical protein B0H10DRAFT_473846 [Mycena sp. CBHHK59/15]